MNRMGDLLSGVLERRYVPWGKQNKDQRSIEELADALVANTGEGSGIALATQILDKFDELTNKGKMQFFSHLCERMDVNAAIVKTSLNTYTNKPTAKNYSAFLKAADPTRQELIRRLNQVPGATEKLVAMRADLLKLDPKLTTLGPLDMDFQHLFSSWFNRGFLVLRPITWETPAHILEKIIAYEAVHAIDSWDDLRSRLQPEDRRCFAFFHLSMPDEPLIFVEVALTQGTPSSIQNVLSPTNVELNPDQADTACFYSISNCQKGLRNISFGNFLIKQVAADLAKELPNLEQFVTLSPIPSLVRWLSEQHGALEAGDAESQQSIAAHYLLLAKRADQLPYDPVARFHLGNGAEVHAVHANADTSDKGLKQSLGVMVNYRYVLSSVTENHERYSQNAFVKADKALHKLAGSAKETKGENASA